MLTSEIAEYCKELHFNSSIVEMSEKIQAENNQKYLLKLLKLENLRRENSKKDKLLENAGLTYKPSFVLNTTELPSLSF